MPTAARDTVDAPRRGRPRRRPRGRVPSAVLAATEELLRARPLHQVSVGDIIAAAGVSRSSFYAHFPSKTAVVAEGLRRVMDEVAVAVRPDRAATGGLEQAIRLSLERWVAVCRTHAALLRTASEEWPHDPQLRDLWSAMLHTMTVGTARMIEGARRAGAAPPGADADALAACLMWGHERVLHVSLVGGTPGLPGPDAIVEPLTQIVLGGVYGRPPRAGRHP